MFNKPLLPLPRLGLLLLCVAWLLPGLIGHAPWKGGDGEHFVQLWLLLKGGAAPQSVSAMPLYYWVATATAWLTSAFLPLADGARLASGVFIALALFFVARAARVLYGEESAWAAALTLLGCMGLLVRGHELNAATAQFAAAAIMLYGLAALPQAPRSGWAMGGGAVLMLLAGGAAEAALFLLLAGLMPLLLEAYRTPAARRALARGVGVALVAGLVWLAYLATQAVPLRLALNLPRWFGKGTLHPAFYVGTLGWYAWPAWPLAAWAVYRGRRQWRTTPGIVLPAAALLALLILYVFDTDPGEEQGLVLLLPLALLGASGLLTLRRGAAYALLWFGIMLFGFLALVLWVYWSAHDLGSPARLAARLTRLGMTHVGVFRPRALALGGIVTLAWIVFLARVRRSPLRPILVWTAGMTFSWGLLMALFQAPLDQRLSYASVGEALAARVPSAECIRTVQVRSQQRLLLTYHSGRRLAPGDSDCNWLLVETRQRDGKPHVPAGWVKVWDGARPGDRADHFHLYGRR